MNFSDPHFIFIFLPIALFLLFTFKKYAVSNQSLLILIILISITFYFVNPILYITIFLSSIIVNYCFAKILIFTNNMVRTRLRLTILITIIGLNLSALIYFKFLLLDVNPLTISRNLDGSGSIVLPLGISFYTFQQIALQIDCYWKKLKNIKFFDYCSFISFFPQLIAGPIVYYKEMVPQFKKLKETVVYQKYIIAGILIFSIGLSKKTLFADNLANGVDRVYLKLVDIGSVPFLDAWFAVIAFPLQIYFDFSGYTDMACGLALLFGLQLCQNFNSPFKAQNVIEYWSTWHMSLMRFFRDYIFNPISIPLTRYSINNNLNDYQTFIFSLFMPVMVVFILTGVWHGSSLNFLLWGLVHGFAVTINHFWKHFKFKPLPKFLGWFLTYLFIAITLILIRADNFNQFTQLFNSLFIVDDLFSLSSVKYFSGNIILPLLVVLLLIFVKICPNSNEIVKESILDHNSLKKTIFDSYDNRHDLKVFVAGFLLGLSFIALTFNSSNFIYFQF